MQEVAPLYEPIFIATNSYGEVQKVLRDRAAQLSYSRNVIDAAVGWAPGLASKVLAERFSKRLGPSSLCELMEVLGLKMLVIDDPEAIERSQKLLARFESRKQGQARWNNKSAHTGAQKKAAASLSKKTRPAKRRAA